MSVFVDRPNLPLCCDSVLLGAKYGKLLLEPLRSLNLSPILIPGNPYVDKRLSGHADLSVLHGGGERVFLAPCLRDSRLFYLLSEMNADIVFPEITQSCLYPKDAQMNLCAVGDKLIFGAGSAGKDLTEYFTQQCGYTAIPVKQGYSRCSVCIVDDKALITSDKGIAAAAESFGFDILLINPGYIELEGFAYGFIGGAAFKISSDKLAFTGTIDHHPDAARICDFLKQHEVDPVFLTDLPVFDIGGSIPLTEKQ